MNISLYIGEAIQVLSAFVIGAVIGLEREFRGKPAGFRTMILICVGSCLYTILSHEQGGASPDRIASNIVTGIGFLGAGVIFKEGMTVNGLTTAAIIWITAALGMSLGYKNYALAVLVSIIVVLVLFVLNPVQKFIRGIQKVKDYQIKTVNLKKEFRLELEQFFYSQNLNFKLVRSLKENGTVVYIYRISSPEHSYELLNEFLIRHQDIQGFEA